MGSGDNSISVRNTIIEFIDLQAKQEEKPLASFSFQEIFHSYGLQVRPNKMVFGHLNLRLEVLKNWITTKTA